MSRSAKAISSALQRATQSASAAIRTPVGYLVVTAVLMLGFYSVLYGSYDPAVWPGTWLLAYLEFTAQASALVLQFLGETVTLSGTQVLGRFPYVVALDCAALDAQALFAAAVLAFPAKIWKRAAGVAAGLGLIFIINTARLVALYFAGIHSLELFHSLHEEVFVVAVVALVCTIFLAWAMWAREAALPAGSTHVS
jgi:exosortase/archaeosortase family protein